MLQRRRRAGRYFVLKKRANVDIRKVWTDIDNAEYLCDKLNIPNCRIVIRVDRELWSPDRVLLSHDTRYFLSSLDPGTGTPEDLGHLVRDHWQVENCLYLVKDRWWDEDKHYLKRPGVGPVFAMLTNAALSVLRLVQQSGDPLTKTAENFHYSPRKATQLLGFDRK